MSSKSRAGSLAGTSVGFVVILVWCLLPVAWIISLSFKSAAETGAGSPHFLPQDATLDNYKTILGFGTLSDGSTPDPTVSDAFLRALLNSFGVALIATALSVVFATLAAYAIARLEFRGKRLVLSLALAIAMFPVVSLVGPLFDMWRTFHLFNTWPGLIIPYMTFTLPLAIWTLSAFFREIPWEMEQAAQVDGATSWQAFRKVIVPLAAPGVFTAAILTFFFAWNEFVLAISLTSTTSSRTVPAQMSFFVGADPFNPPYGQLATASVVVTVPIIVIVLLFQRKIVAGLTSGAVKG
ncbi:carbohydrate ABC transporter permease [Nocardioides sp. MH1]|uniref:carbohydrate ABC transporter permease n=1 Tax=Nocardioides sp. MH1 TaxID=3242490 RepID=UPI003522508F